MSGHVSVIHVGCVCAVALIERDRVEKDVCRPWKSDKDSVSSLIFHLGTESVSYPWSFICPALMMTPIIQILEHDVFMNTGQDPLLTGHGQSHPITN